MTMHNK